MPFHEPEDIFSDLQIPKLLYINHLKNPPLLISLKSPPARCPLKGLWRVGFYECPMKGSKFAYYLDKI